MSFERFIKNAADGYDHIDKDPQAILPYTWNLTSWLAAVGGANFVSTVVTLDSGIVAVGSPVVSGGRVSQKISGGTLGTSYKAVLHVVTDNGAEDDFTIVLDLKNK